jgi:nifR3 family TIM-barrel protein
MKINNKMNFWQKLDKPFFCLAPMADVTDIAFRAMLAKYGKNADNKNQVVFWTEFVSADGLCNPVGRKHLAHILKFSKIEKPIVAQVFGANPVNMEKACRIISELGPSMGRAGFDGIDINMGCPDKSVVKQGAGSALIRTPALAREIIRSAIAGANGLPVSVKTRIGFNKDELDTWIPELLKEDISALTIHARTKKQMSKVPANWDYVKRVVELVKKSGKNTCPNLPQGRVLVIGNGDIKSIKEGKEKIKETGCDGVMVGRGVFGNPWFFAGVTQPQAQPPRLADSPPRLNQGGDLMEVLRTHHSEEIQWILLKIKALVEHIKIFDKKLLKTKDKTFSVMKKHFKAYINGFDGAKELRNKLMETETPKEALAILTTFQKTLK